MNDLTEQAYNQTQDDLSKCEIPLQTSSESEVRLEKFRNNI